MLRLFIVGIVCEYNPLHLGHIEQLRAIDNLLGKDNNLKIALMSGNYVQRGEPAIVSKSVRARAAVLSGVDLVLEYPFPYSCAPAKNFADNAVALFDRLGAVDYLCFGSESADAELLTKSSKILASDEFERNLSDAVKNNPEKKNYATLRAETFEKMSNIELLSTPNDILALEYLTAIEKRKSAIKPLVISRVGDFSAGAARKLMQNGENLDGCLPQTMTCAMKGETRVVLDDFSKTLVPYFRLSDPDDLSRYAEMTFDLACRIVNASKKSRTVGELVENTASKNYTNARIRRALLLSYFRVTADRLNTEPNTVRLLAANDRGRTLLREISKKSALTVVSSARPKAVNSESNDFSLTADSIYALVSGMKTDFYSEKPFLG